MQETQVRSLGWENPLEKKMAAHSSVLSWEIPWTEEPGELQSIGLQRVRHNLVTEHACHTTTTTTNCKAVKITKYVMRIRKKLAIHKNIGNDTGLGADCRLTYQSETQCHLTVTQKQHAITANNLLAIFSFG